MSRITAPVGEVTTPITRGRNGSLRLRSGSNSPSAASAFRRLLEQRHQRALARQLQPFDDELILRPAGISGQLAGRDDLGAVLGLEGEHAALARQITASMHATSSLSVK